MRFFPSAARHRVALACACAVSVASLTVPLAHADEDDLKTRQREVRSRIADAEDDLHEASKWVTHATGRLDATLDRLQAARDDLADVRGRLGAARERDAQLRVELEEAEHQLELATAAAVAAAEDVERQRALVRSTSISIYTGGDPKLRAIGTLLEAGSLEEVETIRLGQRVLTGRQTTVFDDLAEVEAQAEAKQEDVEEKKAAVEDKKEEAAALVQELRGLYAESAEATARVRGLVGEARERRQAAFAARSHDREVLQALRARERAIHDRLVELARSQRDQVGFRGQSDGYLSYPTSGPVTSPYGYRTHPIYGYYSLHNGTDFGTGCGAPLYASAGGTVIDTYYDSVYGNRLFLSLGKVNGKSLVLIYNHLAAYRVSEGARIERGTVVGLSGTTGWSTGCHLHFTVMENGVAVDPMNYL